MSEDEMNEDQLIIHVDTIDELDEALHEQTMLMMKEGDKPSKLAKIVMSQKLKDIGIENIHDIIMMRTIDRALNNSEIKNLPSSGDKGTFEGNILPVLKDFKEVTYH